MRHRVERAISSNNVEKIITIEVLGEQFKFRADDDRLDPNLIAEFLMQELKQVESQFSAHARKTDKLAILAMAALNIAKQNIELKNNQTDILKSIATRAAKLDRIVESGLEISRR